ncbi:MAG: hypothetical protein HDT28_05580 [Clostridiales bacterium]|nr:hypothetical protein [Clostridiales bacterium]
MKNRPNNTNRLHLSGMQRALILIVALITAIAISVTCALCFNVFGSSPSVDDVTQPEQSVTTSANRGTLTGDWSGAGKLSNGDVITYAYTGGVQSIKLPKGTFTLSVSGASGGTGYSSYTAVRGLGGTTKATITLTAATTLYIVVGGQGGNNTSSYLTTLAGGYNGGGAARSSRSCGHGGGGGGGATHIATATGTLSSLSGNTGAILIVAGGGGGAGNSNSSAYYGGGGGTTKTGGTGVVAGGNAGTGANGGQATAGGTASTSTRPGSAGSFGTGGQSSTSNCGGGGGGGGYYGGAGGANKSSCVAYGGGGGASYVKAGMTNSVYTRGTTAGNGSATITCDNVNVGPTSRNATITSTAANYYRGTSRNLTIAASSIAYDPDYTNISGGNTNNVYYTNGTTTNYDTLPAANAGLFLNSACTTLATNYLDWTWAASTLTITNIKKIPRNGVDGATADRRLTLYTRVRDAFGSTTTRGVSVAMFYLTVNDYAITSKAAPNTASANATVFKKTGYEYRYGLAATATTGTDGAKLNYQASDNAYKVYHPSATNRKTVFLPKPISPNDTTAYTIYASDLYTDSDTSYDKVAFKSVENTTSTAYYTITYNADSTYATGLYPSLTVKATGVRPPQATYVKATITAQTSETATKVAIGSTNTDIDLVFRIANTRPYYASSDVSGINTGIATEPYVELKAGETKPFSINSLVYDIDDGNNLTSYFAQGTTNLIVPSKEYVQVDMSNLSVKLKGTSNYAKFAGSQNNTSTTTAMGNTDTGFNSSVIALAGSGAAANACVTYQYTNNKTISFTARAATTYMYSDFDGKRERTGDFYVLVRIIDPSDTSDTGLWYPIAIKVKSSAPTATSPAANFSLGFEGYTPGTQDPYSGNGSNPTLVTGDSVYLSPISYMTGGSLVAAGTTTADGNAYSGSANPFLQDSDMLVTTVGGHAQLSEAVFLDTRGNADPIIYDNTEKFFNVELVTLNIPSGIFNDKTYALIKTTGIVDVSNYTSSNTVAIKGLKITALRATNDEYFRFRVKVVDVHDTTVVSTIPIFVKVENRAVSPRRGTSDASQPINYTSKGTFLANSNIGAKAVNYTIERNDVVQITPYDFVYDPDVNDVVAINPSRSEFNSNPEDDGFSDLVTNSILKSYSVTHAVSPTATLSSTPVTAQTLSFANTDNFLTNAGQYSSYVTVGFGTVQGIPVINITGNSRTTSAVVQLRFTVSDGYSNMEFLVTVTVLNAKPVLNTAANNKPSSSTDKRVSAPYSMAVTATTNNPTSYQFTSAEVAYDKDGDTPTFVPGTIKVAALLDKTKNPETFNYDTGEFGTYFTEYLKVDGSGNYVKADASDAKYDLSDYISASLSKNSMGEDVIVIRALSSTQLFPLPIYVIFDVQDGYRAQVQYNTLCILVDVVNTLPTENTETLTQTIDESNNNHIDYHWMIKYDNTAEKRQPRYIFNSKELHDSGVVNASANNKMYLFDDADAMQNVILAPVSWATNSSDDKFEQPIAKVDRKEGISESAFNTYTTSAVIYSQTYQEATGDSKWISVEILYYKKTLDTNGREIFVPIGADDVRSTCQYWAIKITDNGNGTEYSTRFGIAVKDDHDGATLYNATKTETLGEYSSTVRFIDLYYDYESPNITAMHEYYRTDPNVEAKTLVDASVTSPKTTDYLINTTGLGTLDYPKKDTTVGYYTQDKLDTYAFAERFQYAYFAKTVTITSQSDSTFIDSAASYKHFPSSPFYYDPIKVSASVSNGTKVPMSYIAMPADGTVQTEGRTHVTFANAYTSSQANALLDNGDSYKYWGTGSNLDLVLDNLTLTDNKGGRWSGSSGENSIKNNPYIDITYEYDLNYINSEGYINDQRFYLSAIKTGETVGAISEPPVVWDQCDGVKGVSMFREDKYGFNIKKKSVAERSSGLLTLTVALKTVSNTVTVTDSKVQYISVQIDVDNSKPSVEYTNPETNKTNDIDGYSDDVHVKMTTSDVAGKTVALIDKKATGTDSMLGDYRLYYNDADKTDTMKFYMASALTGGLSAAESEHIQQASTYALGGTPRAVYNYYDLTVTSTTSDKGETYAYKYYDEEYKLQTAADLQDAISKSYVTTMKEANPGYNKFFTVSPSEGVSSTLQFIPVAKTQLNIPQNELKTTAKQQELYEKYHLKVDGDYNIYYPFRVIFYDEVDGSSFLSGNYVTAIIRVYVNNDPLALNRSVFYNEKGQLNNYAAINSSSTYRNNAAYSFSLSKNTNFFVDVTNLLVDNDIVLGDSGSFVTSEAQLSSSSDDEDTKTFKKYTHDYLTMPETAGGDSNYTYVGAASRTTLPVKVKTAAQAKTENGIDVTDTTIMFTATSAFSGTVDLLFSFKDSAKPEDTTTPQEIVFSISYNNENPTANAATFKGADIRTIEMTTGQSFKLYAADRNDFLRKTDSGTGEILNYGDQDGGFSWYETVKNNYASENYAEATDATALDAAFGTNTSNYLGSLIVGSDDAASTLRFQTPKYDEGNTDSMITHTGNYRITPEGATSGGQFMCYEFTANGVCNVSLTLTLVDGGGKTVSVQFNIIVRSSAPKTITDQATLNKTGAKVLKYVEHPTGDGSEGTVYEIGNSTKPEEQFHVGDSVSIRLRDFVSDIDLYDDAGLTVNQNADRSYFRITNPNNVNAIDVKAETPMADENIVITATDVINVADKYSYVTFAVRDAHGEVSGTITIRVYITAGDIQSVAASKAYATTIMSYAEYTENYEPVIIPLVSNNKANATLFYDGDAEAESAAYDVYVYAMLRKSGDRYVAVKADEMAALTESEKGDYMLAYRRDGDFNDSADRKNFDLATYTNSFFTISIAQNGKTLTIVPNSASIASSGTSLDNIPLYITVSKRTYNDEGSSLTAKEVAAQLTASVKNSQLMATEATSFNMGYPQVSVPSSDENEEDTLIYRDEEFLTFTGTAGDSLTWDIYNLEDPEYGLFYDYDMLNVKDRAFSSAESIIMSTAYDVVPERAETLTGLGDIVTVSFDNNTHKVTIKINRKTFTGQPPTGGYANEDRYKYSNVKVTLYAADTLTSRAGMSDKSKLAKTVINVRVENDVPEIKTINDFDATETKPAYAITYSIVEGYTLDQTLERGKSLRLNIRDIISDADIDMDEYVLVYSGNENSLMGNDGYLMNQTASNEGRIIRNNETLFNVRTSNANNKYNVSSLAAITFECVSAKRGATATVQLCFRDSIQTSVTSVLTINLTVDNLAPYEKPGANKTITVMGAGKDAVGDEITEKAVTLSILDFITDDNGDAYDAEAKKAEVGDNSNFTHTYTYIEEISVYNTDNGDPSLRPSIYGPNKDGVVRDDQDPIPEVTVCSVDPSYSDAYQQSFTITPTAGVYGRQKVGIKIKDSGYIDGAQAGVIDGKTFTLIIDIIIANPLEDVDLTLETQTIAYGVTRSIDVVALLGEQNAQGYTIKSLIEDGTNNLEIYAPGQAAGALTSAATTSASSIDSWRIYAKTEGSSANVNVVFEAGNVTIDRVLPVVVTTNTAPDYKGGKTLYEYTVEKLDDQQTRTIKIYPEMWFEDIDAEDFMAFVDPVTSSQSSKVKAMFDYDDTVNGGRPFILLTFNYRGEADINFNVTDLSGRVYNRTITVTCTNAPEMTMWVRMISFIQAHWFWFWIILACILLFLILLIILIIVIVKKRKMRREIEALLESETELEEEMMRLNAAAAPYQSFGYLPPTSQTMTDTGFMIGGGQSAPMQNSLQLNAGSGIPSQSAQINSVPGSNRPASMSTGAMPPRQGQPARPATSMPGNMQPQRPAQPQQQQRPQQPQRPASNDGFNPDEF